MILTLSIILASLIITIILCLIFYNDDNMFLRILFAISITGIIFIVAFGFGMFFTLSSEKIKIENVKKTTILKSKTTVYVEIEKEKVSYTEKSEYDDITDSTQFYKITYYNYYGGVNKTVYSYDTIYKNKQKNIKINY